MRKGQAAASSAIYSVPPASSNRVTAAALNSTVYRLRVFFVMPFRQMMLELNIWVSLAGQGHGGQGREVRHVTKCGGCSLWNLNLPGLWK